MRLPIHLGGLERAFAAEGDVTGPLEPAVAPAMREIQRRSSGRFAPRGSSHTVRAAETPYGYLATIVAPVAYDPAHVEELSHVVRQVILTDANVRRRVGSSSIEVRWS